ncbi:MAG TPA: RNA 2',3'-cyclic phosphodiesterase [Burkholderiales bacterium]|nr:RNA 2',3'-cyclic phosphodiesterase [Burkholderiales bacterium]
MRLFFAVWPPAESARVLAQWARSVEREAGGKATAQDKIHLTLAFLGGVESQKAIAAAQRVKAAAHELAMEQARYWRQNSIVWAGPREAPQPLLDLVERLKIELYRAEYILERRPFAAHVTLLRKARPPESLPPLPPIQWPVSEFLLMQSVLSSSGSRYQPLARFELQ